ncbi:LuxR C-terminal-related transcriptional regulator [Streptomyces sp. NBC_01429]|uniref:LuxR C-terminal-related transcriptional regulator n=1 Tax=Streptomyces sp. NBC_01429 TaxID=2903862 RepID=UPI003FCDDBB9
MDSGHPVTPEAPAADYALAGRPAAQSGLCMASLDNRLTIRQANQEFFWQFGGSASGICGLSFREVVHPSVQQPLMRKLSRLIEGKHQRFVTPVIAIGQGESAAFTVPLTAVSVRGNTPDTNAILVMMPSTRDAEDPEVVTKKILTRLDAQILEGIAAGVSTVPLASRLHLSPHGIEYHVARLFRKLKVPNRAALVSRAYSMGVLKVGTWPPKVVEEFVE